MDISRTQCAAFEIAKLIEVGKTTPLSSWAPLLQRDDVLFVRLQKISRDADQHDLGASGQTLLDSLTEVPDLNLVQDLDGLAALVSACDLVISVSNSNAHLAGALGVPTWVLLPFGHFQPWYWFKQRTDSPWYASVKLYRPSAFDDWSGLIAHVGTDLDAWQRTR